MAEHTGFPEAVLHAEPRRTFFIDCAAVNADWQKGLGFVAAAARPQGSIWREASILLQSGKGGLADVQKCKAHKCIDGLEGKER